MASSCEWRFIATGVLAATVPIVAASQGTPVARRVVVQVRVIGPDSVPLPDVNVAISRSDVGAMLIGSTDGTGTRLFSLDVVRHSYTILARRPGFRHAEARLTFGPSDSMTVVLPLIPVRPRDLGTVRIRARSSSYVLTSDQITRSRRYITDAFDALRKLRPRMLYDRDRCKGEVVGNVWINGRRVLFMSLHVVVAPPPATIVEQRAALRRRQPAAIDSTLATIRAEHLAEIRLVNCWDTSLPGIGAKNALYVSLKPGVDWSWKVGSFIADTSLARPP